MQDILRGHKMRATGACVGAVIGLVAVTPAAGFINIGAAFIFGVVGSVVCSGALELMERWGSRYVDDTLDVFAVHGIGEWRLAVLGGLVTIIHTTFGLLCRQPQASLWQMDICQWLVLVCCTEANMA